MSIDSRDAVIIDCVRTAMGKSKQGVFRNVRAEVLSAELMKALVKRNPELPAENIDDVIWGCVKQTREQGVNIARNAALLAGLPETVPAQTVNRLCGSSMTALHSAAQAIQSGNGDAFIIGGVEHMGHVPMDYDIDIAPQMSKVVAKGSAMMGLTAELLAQQYKIARETQDQFALRSHLRAAAAAQRGAFANQLIPIEGHNEQGFKVMAAADEVVRGDASLEGLAQLKPAFNPKGSVTAGNSSALSDGASALLVTSGETAKALGLTPRARVRSMAVAGIGAAVMGLGPVPASKLALKKAGLQLADMDVIELNEAFAAQSLAVLGGLELLDSFDEKVNLNGGAIALGHPLGCSGARISASLVDLLCERDAQLGLATMCIGMGQGVATVLERV